MGRKVGLDVASALHYATGKYMEDKGGMLFREGCLYKLAPASKVWEFLLPIQLLNDLRSAI